MYRQKKYPSKIHSLSVPPNCTFSKRVTHMVGEAMKFFWIDLHHFVFVSIAEMKIQASMFMEVACFCGCNQRPSADLSLARGNVVAQQAKPIYPSKGLSPSWSASNPAPCSCHWGGSGKRPKCLGPAIHIRVPVFLAPSSNLTCYPVVATQGHEPISLSLFFSLLFKYIYIFLSGEVWQEILCENYFIVS